MGWAKLPVDGGAVNARPASELAPGEFTDTSGVRYKAGSKQLYSDIVWTDAAFQPSAYWSAPSFGPFYLSFENTGDWLCMVVNHLGILEGVEGSYVGGDIYFGKADGTQAWLLSDYWLIDNVGRPLSEGGGSVTAAKLVQWGDRYYLITDQGVAEITPPTGTGPPTLKRLGMLVPETLRYTNPFTLSRDNPSPSMLRLGGADSFIGGDSGGVSWVGTSSQLETGNVVDLYVTEYSSTTGVESQPIYYWDETINLTGGTGNYPTVTFPDVFLNDDSTSFRIYFKFWAASTAEFPVEMRAERKAVTLYQAAPIGASLLVEAAGGGDLNSSFGLADVVSFPTVGPGQSANTIPVLAVDGARLIYPAYRQPNTGTVGAVWNDSLIMNDSGFFKVPAQTIGEFLGDSYPSGSAYRQVSKIPTVIRYSAPGDLANQPIPYFMNFASEKEDYITGLLAVNDRLVVFCDNAVHTVRYLPFNGLLASQQGRVKDIITTSVGCPSTRGYTKVETSSGEFAVWVSDRGIEWSNGSGWSDACPDFEMVGYLKPFIDSAVLINNPAQYRLELYIGTYHYSFYYHPSHLKNEHLKMLGPTVLNNIVTGACNYRDTSWRFDGNKLQVGRLDTVTSENPPIDAVVNTGHITGNNPFEDIVVTDLGATHGPIQGAVSLRCPAAVRGRAESPGISTDLPNPELNETGSTGISQRGNWISVNLQVKDAIEGWGIGPLWLKGDEESGANG